MRIETERLIICEFDMSMAQCVHLNSLDEDTRRFLPDEVFETVEEAEDTIAFLMGVYQTGDGPLVYPVLLGDGTNVGYVQLVPVDEEFEVGYHIAKAYTNRGYATEAVSAFLDQMMQEKSLDKVWGICVCENHASCRVLEKCGFEKVFEGNGIYQGNERKISKYVLQEKESCNA